MKILMLLFIIWALIIINSPENSLFKSKVVSKILITIIISIVSIMMLTIKIQTPDSGYYINYFQRASTIDLTSIIERFDSDIGYVVFQWLVSKMWVNENFLFFCVWIIFSISLLFLLKKIFNPPGVFIVFLAYLMFPFTFLYITNVIRQGLSLSLLFLAIGSLLGDKKYHNYLFWIFTLLAPFFHKTSLIFSLILTIIYIFKLNLKISNFVYFISLLLFFTRINETILGTLVVETGYFNIYTTAETISRYEGGVNRIDFMLLGLIIFVFINIVNKKIKDKKYFVLTNIFILFNSVYLLLGFVAYSDRIASVSWFLIPILMFYPFLTHNKTHNKLFLEQKKFNNIITTILTLLFMYGMLR